MCLLLNLENNRQGYITPEPLKLKTYGQRPLNAVAMHVDEDDSLKQGLIDSLGRNQQTILIYESGLYSLTRRAEELSIINFLWGFFE